MDILGRGVIAPACFAARYPCNEAAKQPILTKQGVFYDEFYYS